MSSDVQSKYNDYSRTTGGGVVSSPSSFLKNQQQEDVPVDKDDRCDKNIDNWDKYDRDDSSNNSVMIDDMSNYQDEVATSMSAPAATPRNVTTTDDNESHLMNHKATTIRNTPRSNSVGNTTKGAFGQNDLFQQTRFSFYTADLSIGTSPTKKKNSPRQHTDKLMSPQDKKIKEGEDMEKKNKRVYNFYDANEVELTSKVIATIEAQAQDHDQVVVCSETEKRDSVDILKSLQEHEKQRLEILGFGQSGSASASATAVISTGDTLLRSIPESNTTGKKIFQTESQFNNTHPGSNEMATESNGPFQSDKDGSKTFSSDQELNNYKNKNATAYTGPTTTCNPYEDAIKEALSLLRKHRGGNVTQGSRQQNFDRMYLDASSQHDDSKIGKIPQLLIHTGDVPGTNDEVHNFPPTSDPDGFYLASTNTQHVLMTDTDVLSPQSDTVLVGDAYQVEIENRRRQRQERMAKYASRLAELKQPEVTTPMSTSGSILLSSKSEHSGMESILSRKNNDLAATLKSTSFNADTMDHQFGTHAIDKTKEVYPYNSFDAEDSVLAVRSPVNDNESQTNSLPPYSYQLHPAPSYASSHHTHLSQEEEIQKGVERVLLAILERANSNSRGRAPQSYYPEQKQEDVQVESSFLQSEEKKTSISEHSTLSNMYNTHGTHNELNHYSTTNSTSTSQDNIQYSKSGEQDALIQALSDLLRPSTTTTTLSLQAPPFVEINNPTLSSDYFHMNNNNNNNSTTTNQHQVEIATSMQQQHTYHEHHMTALNPTEKMRYDSDEENNSFPTTSNTVCQGNNQYINPHSDNTAHVSSISETPSQPAIVENENTIAEHRLEENHVLSNLQALTIVEVKQVSEGTSQSGLKQNKNHQLSVDVNAHDELNFGQESCKSYADSDDHSYNDTSDDEYRVSDRKAKNRYNGVLGPLSTRAGGTTGVVLDDSSSSSSSSATTSSGSSSESYDDDDDEEDVHLTTKHSILSNSRPRSPTILESLSAAVSLVTGVTSNDEVRSIDQPVPPAPTGASSRKHDKYYFEDEAGVRTERNNVQEDPSVDDDDNSIESFDDATYDLMKSLCAHILPSGFDFSSTTLSNRQLLEPLPEWDGSNPDEPGYRIVRLNKYQLHRVERSYEKVVDSLNTRNKRVLPQSTLVESDDMAFARDLKEAEDLLDEEEKRLVQTFKSTQKDDSHWTPPDTGTLPINLPTSTALNNDLQRSSFSSSNDSNEASTVNDMDEFSEHELLSNFQGVRPVGRGEMGELEFFTLPIIFKSHVTGFEPTKDLILEPGNVVAGQYLVEGALGTAAFSTAYKCINLNADVSDDHERHVCLKVIKNTKDFFDQSLDEIKILELLRQTGKCHEHNIIEMKTFFYHREHLIIVTELLRQNLFEFGKFILDSREEPYFTIKRLSYVARQCLIGLNFVHDLGLVHSDVKPENLLLASYSRALVKIIDFGSSCWLTDRQSSYVQSRSYRAPEVILGLPYDGRIDIWSLGCVVAEMYTGEVTFQNDSIVSMLSRIEAICGPFPRHMIGNGRQAPRFFSKCGLLYEKVASERNDGTTNDDSYSDDDMNNTSEDDDEERQKHSHIDIFQPKKTTLTERLNFDVSLHNQSLANNDPLAIEKILTSTAQKQNYSLLGVGSGDLSSTTNIEQSQPHRLMFIDFVRQMLIIDPELRPTAKQLLGHPLMLYAATLVEADVKYPSSASTTTTTTTGTSSSK